jgi:formate hydrogenlyase subunit 6/NADH:ubiquinone oxidoreductase subunit I/flavodoxin
MSNVELYYFSGTGNSLHVAKELQKRIPETSLIPIVSLLTEDVIETNGETVGFVFPVHGLTIPIPVKMFLKKLNLTSADYVFAVATRGGTKCFALNKIDDLLKKKGKSLGSFFVLNMASNQPKFKGYCPATTEEMANLESDVQNRLGSIQKVIVNKEKHRVTDTEYIYPSNYLIELFALFGMAYVEFDGLKDYFYSDLKCVGCGTCEMVCLSRKITMIDKKPVWQKNVKCYLCNACLNYCPEQSVQIKSKWYMKSYTDKNERYPHPYATADDIAGERERKECPDKCQGLEA